jgi:hypothetical protein
VDAVMGRHTEEWKIEVSKKLKGKIPWNKGIKMK